MNYPITFVLFSPTSCKQVLKSLKKQCTFEQFLMNIFLTTEARDVIQTVLESTENEQKDDFKIDSKFRHTCIPWNIKK